MYKRKILIFLIVGFVAVAMCLVFTRGVLAADDEEKIEEQQLEAVAGENKNIAIGRNVVFDGSKSTNNKDGELRYLWDFGDGTSDEGMDVVHIYEHAGEYVATLMVDNGEQTNANWIKVSVYDDLIILITDKISTDEELDVLKKYAARQNVLLVPIIERSNDADYIVEGEIVNALMEAKEDLTEADIILAWTEGSLGLDALARFAQEAKDLDKFDISNKGVVAVVESPDSNTTARVAQVTFNTLKPEYILLTKESAMNAVIDSRTSEGAIIAVRESGIESRLIGTYSERAVENLGVTNFMSYTINYLVNGGVKLENIILLLMLPIIATIIAFARQFLGIKTFGIYTPSIITLSFVAMGLKYGLVIFLVILVVATLMRLILNRFRLLYLPRMAIVLTVVAFALITMFVLGVSTDRTGIIALSVFPMLVLVILVEKFISIQIEKGALTAVLLSIETLVVSVACYYLVNWEGLKNLLIGYPEVVLLTIVINILLGKWVGLRISEYFRFRSLNKMIREKK